MRNTGKPSKAKSVPTPKAKIVRADYGDGGRKVMTNVLRGVPKRRTGKK
jgi:hypothetical protein